MIMKKSGGFIRFFELFTAILMFIGTAPRADAAEVIKVGTVGATIGAFDAAVYEGEFETAGLSVEKIVFSSGVDAIAALVSDSIDLFIGSYEHVLRQIDKGLDVKAFALISNTQGYKLITRTDSPYQSLADLKGKAVGVTKVGSLSDTVLRKTIAEAGLNPDRDIEIINGGTGSTMVGALESGNIAAGMIFEPLSSELLGSGKYRLLHYADYETAGLVIMGTEKWVASHAGEFRSFLDVIRKENLKVSKAPGDFARLFSKDFPGLSDDILTQAIANTLARSPSDLVISDAAAEDVLNGQLERDLISRKIEKSEAVDGSYLPKD
ncbi:MAG: ABC transporter substrate-binding protein [Synergistaceae bacterium]|jgi:ABC-type nitrate/sulfonate/bicarbonate transport system substrate-binding protein|nr:ABC transporter substrate-binding protein [Synergistaceae bacterium]